MSQIEWSAFSWEAFATLAAAIIAVLAAIYIGIRQANILRDQEKIIRDQNNISNEQIKVDLFEKRFEVYESTRKTLGYILAHAEPPDNETKHDFLASLDKSKFLFSSDTNNQLQDLWKNICEYAAVKNISDAYYRKHGEYGDENLEKIHKHNRAFNHMFENLSDIFGTELDLSND